ncbi:MAG: hypothetical protein HFG72_02865 [Hungatella sp.]|nr:hypothetical protein [Hungatella sp.]
MRILFGLVVRRQNEETKRLSIGIIPLQFLRRRELCLIFVKKVASTYETEKVIKIPANIKPPGFHIIPYLRFAFPVYMIIDEHVIHAFLMYGDDTAVDQIQEGQIPVYISKFYKPASQNFTCVTVPVSARYRGFPVPA